MASIRTTFFAECDDLLESVQDALTVMEDGPASADTIDALFRAVHSIKGGAGAFGLEALVDFAHGFEAVLDQLRGGHLAVTPEVVGLFFSAADLLQDHVQAARRGETVRKPTEQILDALERLAGEPDYGKVTDFAPVTLALTFSDAAQLEPERMDGKEEADTGGRHWTIVLEPTAALYGSGNEALLVLRALCALGEARIACEVPDDLSIADEAAEQPRLTWRVQLETDAGRAEIDEVFDFVADVCAIDISERSTGVCRRGEAGNPNPPPRPTPLAADALVTPASADDQLPASRGAIAAPLHTDATTTIRVDVEKVDQLVNLVGELVINQAMLSQSVALSPVACPEVTAGLDAFLTLTRDLQDRVMSVRAQPVKPLFQRMARVVREASAQLGKEVRLNTEGSATEVDRTVIERLAEPLTHMIRNAVDHGIEEPRHRIAAGKPREGQITLSASHRAGRILIEVEDDGAGIDRSAVLDRARSRGLVEPDAVLDDAEIDNLLFLPGFSTADEVSALSGRGVGMDVVKRAIELLGGRLSTESVFGRGTRFLLSLPLTLAVLDGMVVQVAGQTLVMPLSAIIETAALSSQAISRIGGTTEVLQMRGALVPLVDLGVHLGFRATDEVNREGIVLLTAQDNGTHAALIVDTVKEQRQVVIKGLDPALGRIPGIAAATILGDGRIALIVDPSDLTRRRPAPASLMRMAG